MVSKHIQFAWDRTYAWLWHSKICDPNSARTTYVTSFFHLHCFLSFPSKIASRCFTSCCWLHNIYRHLNRITYMLSLFRDHLNIFCHMLPLLLILPLHAHALSVSDLLHPLACMLATCKPTYTASFICIVHYIMLLAVIYSSLKSRKYFRSLLYNYYMLLGIHKHSIKNMSCYFIHTYHITSLLLTASITSTFLYIVTLVLLLLYVPIIFLIHILHVISKIETLIHSFSAYNFMINSLIT